MDYDTIAETYDQDAMHRDDRASVLVPSARHYCGDVRGLAVLDLACGAGYFSRLFQEWGARRVVGVDVSAEMLRQAGEGEFLLADVASLGCIGEFDLVFAGFSAALRAGRAFARGHGPHGGGQFAARGALRVV